MAEPPSRGRPRLLILNAYYWPGPEASAHLLTELCESLAADYDVHVITGAVQGADHRAQRVIRERRHDRAGAVDLVRPGAAFRAGP